MMVRLAALVLAIGLAATTAASAQTADLRVTIVEYGLYTADTKSEKLQPDGVTDTVIENLCHVATTTTIPLKQGTHFGFRYRVDGVAAGQLVMLGKTIEFPTVVKPPGAKALSGIWRAMPSQTGTLIYAGYGLDLDWEMMPGRWSFYILQGDRKLAEMSFDVVDGADAPAPSAQASTCFRLSAR